MERQTTLVTLLASAVLAGSANAGEITTIFEGEANGGVTLDAAGDIYAANYGPINATSGSRFVWKISPTNAFEPQIFATDINIASGNDFDSMGNLFQSNFGGDRISRIDQSGVVTNLTSFVDGPVGIVIDADDNLYVSSCLDNQVIRITPDDMASLFVGSTQFNCPNGITQAPNGDFYMINWHSGDIFRITPAGEFSLFASVPPEGGHVTIAGDRLYATSPGTGRIFGFQLEGDNAGELVQRIGAGGVGSADGTYFVAQFNRPNGLTADATGEILYVTDQNGVRRIALEDEAEPPPPPPPPPPATPPAPPASSGGGGSVAWGFLIVLGGLAAATRRRRSVS